MDLRQEHFKVGERFTGEALCGSYIFCGVTPLDFVVELEITDFVTTEIDTPIEIDIEQDVCNVYMPIDFFVAESTINDFNCSITIPTMLVGEVDIDGSNWVEECIVPEKDSLVRKTVPVFNYGKITSLRVGNSDIAEDEVWRTYIEFDVSHVPDFHLEYANLKLRISNTTDINDLEIYHVISDWHEEGITWAGQPTIGDKIKTLNVDGGIREIEIDIKDAVLAWIRGDVENFGIMLKTQDETILQDMQMYSRESIYPPQLCMQYLIATIENDRYVYFDSSINVRGTEDLPSSILVDFMEDKSTFLCSIDVNRRDIMPSFISVNRDVINSNITIADKQYLSSNIWVGERKIEDFDSNIFINRNHLESNIFVVMRDDLDSNIYVGDTDDLQSSINVIVDGIYSIIEVYNIDELPGSIQITGGQLSSSIYVNRTVLDSNIRISHDDTLESEIIILDNDDLESDIRITYNSDINSSITVFINDDLQSDIIIKDNSDLTSSINVVSSMLNSNIFVVDRDSIFSNIIISYNDDLSSDVLIRFTEDFNSSIVVKQYDYDDLESAISIPVENHFDSSIVVRQYNTDNLVSNISIKTVYFDSKISIGESDYLDSSIFISGVNFFNGNIVISETNYLDSSIMIKERWYKDLLANVGVPEIPIVNVPLEVNLELAGRFYENLNCVIDIPDRIYIDVPVEVVVRDIGKEVILIDVILEINVDDVHVIPDKRKRIHIWFV